MGDNMRLVKEVSASLDLNAPDQWLMKEVW